MNSMFYLLSTVVNPDGGAPVPDAAVNAVGAAPEAAGSLMQSPIFMIVMYCIVIFGAMYFFSIKPQKKREAKLSEMRSQIKVGDSVLLNNGMYGKIVDVTAECFIIEFGTNKGIRIPVIKQEVAIVREPNLTNKEPEVVQEENTKPSLFGFGKKKDQ